MLYKVVTENAEYPEINDSGQEIVDASNIARQKRYHLVIKSLQPGRWFIPPGPISFRILLSFIKSVPSVVKTPILFSTTVLFSFLSRIFLDQFLYPG